MTKTSSGGHAFWLPDLPGGPKYVFKGTPRLNDQATEAQPTLIEALGDDRHSVVMRSAEILALFNDIKAQQAICNTAMNAKLPGKVRISLIDSLALSATHHGNLLTDTQIAKLLKIVNTAKGDMAQAAARAHGALTLPASHVVDMITK
mgnify:CR=1 FL=1